MWRIAIKAVWFLLILTTFGAYRSDIAFNDPRLWGPVLAIAVTYSVLPFVRWETALHRPSGEALMAMAAVLLIAALAMMSTLTPIRPLVFIDYFAVIAFTASLGGRFLHVAATSILLTLNFVMSIAFNPGIIPVQELTVQSATLIVVAVVLSAVTSEFRLEAYHGHNRELELRRRETDLQRLYEVSRTMSDGKSLSDVLPTLVGKIGTFLDAQVGLVLFHQPRTATLEVVSPIWTSGHQLDIGGYVVNLRDRGHVASVFSNRHPAQFSNAVDFRADDLFDELGISTALSVPLIVDTRPIGVMVIADKQSGDFSAEDLETLESLAAPAALILAQLERYEVASETSRKMEEVAQMKTDFVSVVSHELRTPLTSIIGSLATLARPELAPTAPAAHDLLASARTQSDRLRRLIEDLLMVSRIDNNALPQHPQMISLNSFVDESVSVVPGARDVVVRNIADDLSIEIDPDHLARILRNIIENAVKYAPGSQVHVSATQAGATITIKIADHGDGIPRGVWESAFERFTQLAPSSTRSHGGTGLGLWIVKSLIESMGGLIHLDETPGGGATFVVSLPLRAGFMTSQTDPEFSSLGSIQSQTST